MLGSLPRGEAKVLKLDALPVPAAVRRPLKGSAKPSGSVGVS
jgi:hypothetical protein